MRIRVGDVQRFLRLRHRACDAAPGGPAPDDFAGIRAEALDGRLLAGDGILPLGALLDALPQGLPISIELRSQALRTAFPDPVARAAYLLTRTRDWFVHVA